MLFKVIAALIAIVAFPFTAALMSVLTASVDGMTLLAAYHTAYNVVGVAVLLPATQWFTRIVERLLPSRQTALQRALDPSALASPVIAVESARRVVADVLATIAASVSAVLSGGAGPTAQDNAAAAAALAEVRDFLSELKEPPESEAERLRMTSTLHALDHASRLVEDLGDGGLAGQPAGAPYDRRAAELCTKAMRAARAVGRSITSESALSARAAPIGWSIRPRSPRRSRRGRAQQGNSTPCRGTIAPRPSPRSRREGSPPRMPSRGSTPPEGSTGSRITPGVRRRISSAAAAPEQSEAVGKHSVTAISRADAQAVLNQTYSFAQRQRFSFNLTYVGKDMPENGGTGYETEYMLQLYRYGYDKARSGSFWEKKPPQREARQEAAKTVER